MELRGILLPEAYARALLSWARAARPREACGLLLGRLAGEVAIVQRALAARNTAGGNERFEVDPRDHLSAQRDARASGLDVIGAWHRHPQGPSTPSERDSREAVPGWVTLIVDARSSSWRAWVLALDQGAVELSRNDPESAI